MIGPGKPDVGQELMGEENPEGWNFDAAQTELWDISNDLPEPDA